MDSGDKHVTLHPKCALKDPFRISITVLRLLDLATESVKRKRHKSLYSYKHVMATSSGFPYLPPDLEVLSYIAWLHLFNSNNTFILCLIYRIILHCVVLDIYTIAYFIMIHIKQLRRKFLALEQIIRPNKRIYFI